jgi:hypothetical protein
MLWDWSNVTQSIELAGGAVLYFRFILKKWIARPILEKVVIRPDVR